jgi:hypothetical protein
VIATLTFRIDTTSTQKATALRDKCADYLAEDDQVTVIHAGMAQDTQTFEVVGVDTAGKKPFKERTEAKDEDEAEAKVVGGSKTMVVAEVRRA